MADELQRTYKEYSKRKRSAFRGSVKKAYSMIMHNYGHNDPQHSSSDDLSEDSQGEEESRYVSVFQCSCISLYGISKQF